MNFEIEYIEKLANLADEKQLRELADKYICSYSEISHFFTMNKK